MSDQYTRITCGGTPLPIDTPVVGLLFGLVSEALIEIMDADDISTDVDSSLAKLQISLHQAVFPQHQVVGWYRVSADPEPTASDVQTTATLQAHFGGGPVLFCSCKSTQQDEDNNNINDNAESSRSIVTLYEMESGVLVGVEGWKLETSDAEQIAVERVVRERPPNQSSAFVSQTDSVKDSLQKMKDRMGVLLAFLEDTESGKIPVHHGLLRQVQGLTCQMGCLMGAAPKMDAPQLMQHMAVITKAVHTVKGYTEKYKVVQEAKVSSRERRF